MKVFRVTVNLDNEQCGVVFDSSEQGMGVEGRSGRGVITLPEQVRAAVLKAAQSELELRLAPENLSGDPEMNLSTELHRINTRTARAAQLDREVKELAEKADAHRQAEAEERTKLERVRAEAEAERQARRENT